MRIVIVTSLREGVASRCVPALVSSPFIDLAAVILCETHTARRGRLLKRRLKKTWRIGVLGALNGIRIRRWFADEGAEDIAAVCARHGVPLHRLPVLNSPETRSALTELAPDLAISLGNGYIARSVFRIPRLGMINLHAEILPRFQGAQSVIWPLHEGVTNTGITIHCIDEHIDTGNILYQREFPIRFLPTLRETVEYNVRRSYAAVPAAVVHVCENIERLLSEARPQVTGTTYTTPSLRAFRRMLRNHDRLRRVHETAAEHRQEPEATC